MNHAHNKKLLKNLKTAEASVSLHVSYVRFSLFLLFMAFSDKCLLIILIFDHFPDELIDYLINKILKLQIPKSQEEVFKHLVLYDQQTKTQKYSQQVLQPYQP